MDHAEFAIYLKNKLIEEAEKCVESEEVEELTDVLEVLLAMLELKT